MLDFIKRLFKRDKNSKDKLFSYYRNREPICRFSVSISVDRDSEKYKNLKNQITTNTAALFHFATDIKFPDYIIKSEDIISNILKYPISSDNNEEIIKFKANLKKYKEFEDLLNSSNEIIVGFGFNYFTKANLPGGEYIDKNHIYYNLFIDKQKEKISKITKEVIKIRYDKATLEMIYEFGSFVKELNNYKEFYQDITKAIIVKQFEEKGWY